MKIPVSGVQFPLWPPLQQAKSLQWKVCAANSFGYKISNNLFKFGIFVFKARQMQNRLFALLTTSVRPYGAYATNAARAACGFGGRGGLWPLRHLSWVEALQSSVRPMITYAFSGLFAAVKLTSLATLVDADGMSFTSALLVIWDGESQALFAAVKSFWFGARALGKAQQHVGSPERGQ